MIGTRIAGIRNQLGLTQKQFGDLVGVSQMTVSHWENERNKLSPEDIVNVCRVGNVTFDWLLTGVESTFTPPITPLDDPKGIKRAAGDFFPVIARVTAGDYQLFEENILREVFIPMTKTNHRYAVEVDGDSMAGGTAPIDHGDCVLVDEAQSALEGDVVVVLTNGRQLVKQYAGRVDGSIELRSFNPAYPPMFIQVAEVEKILRVIYHAPRGRTL